MSFQSLSPHLSVVTVYFNFRLLETSLGPFSPLQLPIMAIGSHAFGMLLFLWLYLN